MTRLCNLGAFVESNTNVSVYQPELTLKQASGRSRWRAWLLVMVLVYLLLAAVGAIGDGFKAVAGDNAKDLFAFASNPLIALVVGLVATALMQSSSTATSVIVGLVAGGLPMSIAIPMAMGANIGTSLTSTLVSLGHVRQVTEFRKAFAAATVHDCFNLMAVAVLLPIELLFHPLERLSGVISQQLYSGSSVDLSEANFIGALLSPASEVLKLSTSWLPGAMSGTALILVGIALILFVVSNIGKLLRGLLVGRAKQIMHAAIGRGPLAGITSGAVMTVLVQSSSTTTALIVPLAGSGLFSLRQIYAFTLGANVGTTVTALLAATAISGPTAALALQIALVHLLFNLMAILIIFGLPFLRSIPIYMAEFLALLAERNKLYVAGYILGVFFFVPLSCIGISQAF